MAKGDKKAAAAETPAAKKETVVELVKMSDGRSVEFPGKKQLQKSSFEDADGTLRVQLDFRNGETRTVTLRSDMIPKYALHGAEQKLGDTIAGIKKADGTDADIEDKVLAMDEQIARLNDGEWTAAKDTSGMAGTSVLLQAIVKVKGLAPEKVKEFLATKNQAQKIALRNSEALKATVDAIEAEKASKKTKVDITAELGELDALAAA